MLINRENKKTNKILAGIFIFCSLTTLTLPVFTYADDSSTTAQPTQQQLEQQLQAIQNQINQLTSQLNTIGSQKKTLQNQINKLKNQQATLALQIKQTTLQINNLDGQITQTQNQITTNQNTLTTLQSQIANLIFNISQQDAFPFIYTVIAQGNLSDAVNATENYSQISDQLKNIVEQTKQLQDQLNQQKQTLSDQQAQAQNFLSIKTLQQQQVADSVSQQNQLLTQTQGKEANYQALLNDQQVAAAAIRTRIYQLFGVSSQITFGEAVSIANGATALTGVEAPFLLAILTQESNLGKNVGTCNRPGDPPSKSWKVVMKPDRDQVPFVTITSSLGLDPDITPVSCPEIRNGQQIGWGGAMGPAQFIPSTWIGYTAKVSAITGQSPANPWDIKDAFIAAAIKLKSNGADNTSQGEWDAAMRYFSGSLNPAYSFYGDNVLALTAKYKSDISQLNQ